MLYEHNHEMLYDVWPKRLMRIIFLRYFYILFYTLLFYLLKKIYKLIFIHLQNAILENVPLMFPDRSRFI